MTDTPPPSNEELRAERKQRRMKFWSHIEELRAHLLRMVIALVLGTAVSLAFVNRLLEFLLLPMGDIRPVSLHPTESIVVYFRLALMLGVVIALPVILYQLLSFIVPGLTKKERRMLITIPAGIAAITGTKVLAGIIAKKIAAKLAIKVGAKVST